MHVLDENEKNRCDGSDAVGEHGSEERVGLNCGTGMAAEPAGARQLASA